MENMIHIDLLTWFGDFIMSFRERWGAWTSELLVKWFPLRWMIERVSGIWLSSCINNNDNYVKWSTVFIFYFFIEKWSALNIVFNAYVWKYIIAKSAIVP